jgi:type II secretory pathway component PulJ
MKIVHSHKGVSLAELLAALSIAIVLAASILSLYIFAQRVFVHGETFYEVHGDVRMALEWMSRDIRWATRPINSRSSYATNTDELILEVPSVDSSGDVIDIETTFDYIIYHLDGADPPNLQRTVDADTASSRSDETRTVANNVDSLNFSSGGSLLGSIGDVTPLTEIVIDISTSKFVIDAWTHDESRSTAVELRNQY